MKEARELQTLIDQLERFIKEQDEQIKSLQKQIDYLIAEARLTKSEQKSCQCIDQFWCATFDRCKRNESI
jgi:predicted RNase H-like nuclease (RuvC/YqgF family)